MTASRYWHCFKGVTLQEVTTITMRSLRSNNFVRSTAREELSGLSSDR